MVYNEKLDNMEFDWKNTLLANALWFVMWIPFGYSIVTALNLVNKFNDEGLKIMGLVFSLFFVFKMIHFLGHPKLVFCDKKKKHVKKIVHGY